MQYMSLLIKPVSGMCNMDCTYCFYKELVGEKNAQIVMNDTVCDAMLEHTFEIAEEEVIFAFQGGEPLLAGVDFYRSFVEKAERMKKDRKVSYSIQTNGMLLDDIYAEFFKKNDFLVGISLDGTRNVHDYYRTDYQGNGTFYRVLENAKRLSAMGVPVNILSVVTPKLAQNPRHIYKFYKKHGFRFLQFIPCMDSIYNVQGGTQESLTNDQYFQFLKELFVCWKDDFMTGDYVSIRHFDNWVRMCMGKPSDTCSLSGHCGSYFVIERDGSVYPCDFYVHESCFLGNIVEDDFSTIMKRLTASGFLSSAEKWRSKDCEKCHNRDLCRGGCKRDWVMSENGGKTRYCEAMNRFFDFAKMDLENISNFLKSYNREF